MAATIGLFAASMAWIIGISGGPDILVPNSLMSAPVIKKNLTEDVIRGVQTVVAIWMSWSCAISRDETHRHTDDILHLKVTMKLSDVEFVSPLWSDMKPKRKKKKIMSIPPQNIPFWPQMTTDFTFGSLSALSTVPTMPCLTAALYKKRIRVFTWYWIF